MKARLLNQICAEYTLADEVKAQGIYPYYRPIESGQDPVVKMNGKDVSSKWCARRIREVKKNVLP